MTFNAVVGNPPYQGNSSAQLYPLFYLLSIELGNIVSLIFPTGWQKPCAPTAKGLARMNKPEIKNDKQIVFIDVRHNVFPGISGAAEINIILWKRDSDNKLAGMQKLLVDGANEQNVLLVCDQAESDKPLELRTLSEYVKAYGNFKCVEVSSRTPFGLESDAFKDVVKYGLSPIEDEVRKEQTDIKIYGSLNKRNAVRFVRRDYKFPKLHPSFDKFKVLIPCAWGNMSEDKNGFGGSYGEIIIGKKYEVCTKTYTVSGCFDSEEDAYKHAKYLLTRFARGLLYLNKFGIQASHTAFVEVPEQSYDEEWWNLSIEEIDQKLIEKYVEDKDEQTRLFNFLSNNIQTRTELNIRRDKE